MCVGAFISVCQQTETIVALYFYFYHVIAFSFVVVVVFDVDSWKNTLTKKQQKVPWYFHFRHVIW